MVDGSGNTGADPGNAVGAKDERNSYACWGDLSSRKMFVFGDSDVLLGGSYTALST